jgi:hypothetical protein
MIARLVAHVAAVSSVAASLVGIPSNAVLAQQVAPLVVPPDKFDNYCYFNSGVYSRGAQICVKEGNSVLCGGGSPASWVLQADDKVCKPSTPMPRQP